MTTSPGLRLYVLPFRIVEPLLPGPLNRRTRFGGRGTPFQVGDIRTQHQRAGSRHDVIHLAHQIMLSDRVRRRCIKLAAIDDTDADMRFADRRRAPVGPCAFRPAPF
jgi:hypothetical protein